MAEIAAPRDGAGTTTLRAARTLRRRMLMVAAACVIGTLAVAGVSLVVVFEKHVLEMIGKDLDLRWADLARDLRLDADGDPTIAQEARDSRYRTPRSGAYWQISENGAPVLLSPSLDGRPLDLGQAGPARSTGAWFEIETPEGHELYVVERDVAVGRPDGRSRYRLAVALDHAQVAQARGAFVWDMAVVLGLIALVLVAAAAFQLRVTLQPLARLRDELSAIREGRQARFRSAVPAEVAPLAHDLNRLLDGQEQLVRKARERAGALAHGLKTPIAILTAEQRRLEADGQAEVAKRVREQVAAIQTHVERELARARAHGAATALGAYVDASATAERLVRVMSRMPRGEDLAWRCEAPAGLMLRMDPDDFGEILGNLLDNARKWASGSVTLRCEAVGQSVRVTVEDDGPGFGSNASPPSLTAGDRESSAGLGLVIVQDILAAYGASLWIDRAATNGVVSFVVPGAAAGAGRAGAAAAEARDGAPLSGGWRLASERTPSV
ncbi:sensor histidine kinase [Hansschlegelia zhihuaiae]|uniref:histidine kinase n=1 Tax=Hansschlegelia zhihuaiae TaxID=405005 RepID=A0A4Q0MJ34_9HYPH|nr:HAMP domain-containing sensor histidine kinase [Hansschlegelia zhihuaiae]RXF73548.1 HAMP domain-containing histidine kinase [Hansschlegelia zhihuaiae]